MINYNPKNFFTLIFRSWRGSILGNIFLELLLAIGVGFLAYWADHRGVELVKLVDFLGSDVSDARHVELLEKGELLDDEVHSLLILPIGFLLIFRSVIAYSRYWEGRTQMGEMILATREMMRLIAAYTEGDDDEAQIERAELRRLINMLYAVARQHVELPIYLRELSGPSMSMVTPNEAKVLSRLHNRLSIVAQWFAFRMNESVRAGRMSRNDVRLVEARLADFMRAWSGAERIASTPVPYPHVQMLNMLLLIFVYTAPFTFAHRFGGFTPALSFLLALTLLGINAMAAEIENPFGADPNDLPFLPFAAVVEEDSEMILRQRDPDTEKWEKFWGHRALHQRLLREGPPQSDAQLRYGVQGARNSDDGVGKAALQAIGLRSNTPRVGVSPEPVTQTIR